MISCRGHSSPNSPLVSSTNNSRCQPSFYNTTGTMQHMRDAFRAQSAAYSKRADIGSAAELLPEKEACCMIDNHPCSTYYHQDPLFEKSILQGSTDIFLFVGVSNDAYQAVLSKCSSAAIFHYSLPSCDGNRSWWLLLARCNIARHGAKYKSRRDSEAHNAGQRLHSWTRASCSWKRNSLDQGL